MPICLKRCYPTLKLKVFARESDTPKAQRFTPGRNASIHDVLIDATGAAIGLALWWWLRTRILRRQNALISER